MYLNHWGFITTPFKQISADPYPTESLAEATARADYLISQGRRMGVLIGKRGVGKTTSLASIEAEQRHVGTQVIRIDAEAISSRELLWRLAEGLETIPDPADTVIQLWQLIEDRLRENRLQGRPTAMLVDDASDLGPDVQQQLARLAKLECFADAKWTLILAMHDGSFGRINETLLHLIDLRIDLTHWSSEETHGFVQTSLVDAGRYEPIFSDHAIDQIHELTQGLPRHVIRLADYALLTGATDQASMIDAEIVERAFQALRWSPTTVTLAS